MRAVVALFLERVAMAQDGSERLQQFQAVVALASELDLAVPGRGLIGLVLDWPEQLYNVMGAFLS